MNNMKRSLAALFVLAFVSPAFAENLKMTTYYPAPSGNYDKLKAKEFTIDSMVMGGLFFAGVSGTSFYLNKGTAADATKGIVIDSSGVVSINAMTLKSLTVTPNLSSLQAVTATTIGATGLATLSGGVTTTTIGASGLATLSGGVTTTTIGTSGLATLNSLGVTNNATVGGTLGVTNNATVGGTLGVTGNITTSGSFIHSDERLKEDIVQIPDAVAKVQALNGVYFKYKGKEGRRIGLIAQNVEKVFPEAVNTGSDDMKAVDYASLVSVLIEAVKDQQKTISALQMEVEKIKSGL
jgi:hypothetical protein